MGSVVDIKLVHAMLRIKRFNQARTLLIITLHKRKLGHSLFTSSKLLLFHLIVVLLILITY